VPFLKIFKKGLNIFNNLLYNTTNNNKLYHNNKPKGDGKMMNRQERKNMIEFIERMKEIDKDSLLYMTDADIEHIYSTVYNSCLEHAE